VEAMEEMLPQVVNNVRSIRVGSEKNWKPIDFIGIKTIILFFFYLLMVCCIVFIIEIS
jgi:hypothetical protein